MSLLEVRDLCIRHRSARGWATVVDGLSFTVEAGEALGMVGESGSGKSQTALAVMGLLTETAVVSGSLRFEQQELLGLPRRAWDRLRGARIAMVFQDPMTSLNPHLTIGRQMSEVLEQHRGVSRDAARAASLRMLDAVQLGEPARRLRQYPHELSGGQRQRVLIATSLLCEPRLLIADEPTTALDVSVQAQIVVLLAQLRRDFDLALLLIAHDLGLVAELCPRSVVLYAGRAMESGPTPALLATPAHPYTRALLAARPRIDRPGGGALAAIAGGAPDPMRRPAGCVFQPRCPIAEPRCIEQAPTRHTSGDRKLDCHFPKAPT